MNKFDLVQLRVPKGNILIMKLLILLAICLSYVHCQRIPELKIGNRVAGDELLHIQYEQTSITAIRRDETLHFKYDGTAKFNITTCLEFDLNHVC